MKYKIIATDFDGTLLSKEKKVSKENKEALSKCKAKGCKIVGVTARNISSVKNACDVQIFDYLVANNGACIYDVKNNNIDYIFYIDRSIAENITSDFIDKARGIDYCSAEKYYSVKYKVPNRRYFHLEIKDISEVKEQIARMNIFGNNNQEVAEFKKMVDQKYDNLNTIMMIDTDADLEKEWLSINPKGCCKEYTLEYLAKKLNCSMDNVIFFGDGANDINVIKCVGFGVAMGNAIEKVKSNADDVTLSNEENGVAWYLNKMLQDSMAIS